MKLDDLLNQVSCGEDSKHQFKVDVRNADSLASEMAAFANCEGGTIYLGVADDGSTPGLDQADLARINQLTDEGRDMKACSDLLSTAIRSMIDVKEEKDLDSLFSGGKTTALVNTIAGLDDFELVAFLVVQSADYADGRRSFKKG